MATAKKTPAAKKTAKGVLVKPAFPTPKPVAKAAEPAKAPKPLKVGNQVEVTRRNGETALGRVHLVEDKPNGRWVTVNTGDKKKPVLVTARVSQVKHV
jgi:hypothetical protein